MEKEKINHFTCFHEQLEGKRPVAVVVDAEQSGLERVSKQRSLPL